MPVLAAALMTTIAALMVRSGLGVVTFVFLVFVWGPFVFGAMEVAWSAARSFAVAERR